MNACYVYHIKWAYNDWKLYLSKTKNFWMSGG